MKHLGLFFFKTLSTAKCATPLGGSSEVARYDVLAPFPNACSENYFKKCCILEKSRKKLAKIWPKFSKNSTIFGKFWENLQKISHFYPFFVPVSSTAQRSFSNVDTSQRVLSQLFFEPIPAVWRYVSFFNFVSFQNNLLTTPPSLEPVSRTLRFLWTNVRLSHKPRTNKRTFRS